MIKDKTRQAYLVTCPAFGVGEDGTVGFDPSAKECDACQRLDGQMYADCQAEALAARPVEAEIADDGNVADYINWQGPGQYILVEDRNKVTLVKTTETVIGGYALDEKPDGIPDIAGVVDNAGEEKKPIAKERGKDVTKTSILVKFLKKGGTFKVADIVEETQKLFPDGSKSSTAANVYYLMNFAVLLGIVEKSGRGEYSVL